MTSAQSERPRVRSAGVASAALAAARRVLQVVVPSVAFAVDSALIVQFGDFGEDTMVRGALAVDVLRHQLLFADASEGLV